MKPEISNYLRYLEEGMVIATKMAAVLAELEANGVLDSPEVLDAWHEWADTERGGTAKAIVILSAKRPAVTLEIIEKTEVCLVDYEQWLPDQTYVVDSGVYRFTKSILEGWNDIFDIEKIN